jgi:bifunctional enzyme CysN/CysC
VRNSTSQCDRKIRQPQFVGRGIIPSEFLATRISIRDAETYLSNHDRTTIVPFGYRRPIWFTALPASGKSTIAVAVELALVESGRVAYLLDGDNLCHGLSDDLGFSPGDRTENIGRVGYLTRLLADAGAVALASLVSPLKSDREIARALNDAAKPPFIEVYVATSLAECEKRDPKGLYARARSGQLTGMTGVDAPYEPPDNPDLVLDTAGADIDELAARVIGLLDERSPRQSA